MDSVAEGEPKRGRRKSNRGDLRRDALVQAAAYLFWTKGYAATSLADVAKEADVPLGNLYYYYRAKSDLALGISSLFVLQTEKLIDGVCEDETEPRKRLKLLIERIRAAQGQRLKFGCPIATACRDFQNSAPEAAEKAASSFSVLIGFIAQELQKTGQRPSIAMAKAREVIAHWQGGIALAHALGQPAILAEAYGRMERAVKS